MDPSSSFDEAPDSITEPIAISVIAGRYLLFDVNVVTYLRRVHNICGVLIGTIPQMPQQNGFLGLPVELMPEEAKLLVENEIAYIVDDAAWHKEKFNTFEGPEKRQYLDSLRSAGLKAKSIAADAARKKGETARAQPKHALAIQAASRRLETYSENRSGDSEDILFSDDRPASRGSDRPGSQASQRPDSPASSTTPYSITPSISYRPSSLPQNPTQQPDPPVPSSYPLYAHLHSRKYFLMPGLRFGCDYNVYPGDPLRFHSHFLAVGYDWNEEISMVDLIGGGRLGTRVKKGFLIGGKDVEAKVKEGDNVRTFCIEWGGM